VVGTTVASDALVGTHPGRGEEEGDLGMELEVITSEREESKEANIGKRIETDESTYLDMDELLEEEAQTNIANRRRAQGAHNHVFCK
jgi:hypothetical protein